MLIFSALFLITGCTEGHYGAQGNGPIQHLDTGIELDDSADTSDVSEECDEGELYPTNS